MTKNECEEYYRKNGVNTFHGNSLYSYINKGKAYKGKLFKYVSKIEYNNYYDMFMNCKTNVKVIGMKYLDRYIKEE